MNLGLKDKVAIVTGSSRGLGLASAKSLAAEGCLVTISGRTQATLHAAAGDVATSAGGDDRVLAVETDLAHADGVRRLIDHTVDRFGGIDILVNSLGIARGGGLLETSDGEWQEAFDNTLMPAVRASRLAVPHMQRRGGGAIVIIASIFGHEIGGRMTYTAVKAGEVGLTKSLAQQLARFNIRVVGLSPGSILFEGGSWWKRQQDNPDAIADFVKRELPFGRFGKAGEIGDVVTFLVSPRASWISGTTVVVDGCQSRSF
jgi:3-oxoacyl-[acyl-carrier protein] reductase